MDLKAIWVMSEKSEEAKFKLDAEKRFKVEARRNKLFGLWAAERMGMPRSECDDYAREIVRFDLTEAGVDDIVHKVLADAKSRNVVIGEDEIREQLERQYAIALELVDIYATDRRRQSRTPRP